VVQPFFVTLSLAWTARLECLDMLEDVLLVDLSVDSSSECVQTARQALGGFEVHWFAAVVAN